MIGSFKTTNIHTKTGTSTARIVPAWEREGGSQDPITIA